MKRVSSALTSLSAFFCLLLILITVEQVISRYFFSSSSKALQELEWHLFGALFLLSAADALRRNEHVRVDVFYTMFSKRMQALVDSLGILFFLLPTCCILMYFGWEYTLRARAYPSPVSDTHYCSSYFDEKSSFFSLCSSIEKPLRKTILVGERSADPGGLEARWIIKGLIPFGFLIVFLQALFLLPSRVRAIFIGTTKEKDSDG